MQTTVGAPTPVRPSDRATRLPAWVAPAAVGVGALTACLVVAVHDPNVKGSYGYCPFKVATGLDCPGCGLMRGMHALFTGQIARAVDHNIFLPAVFVLAVVAYGRWLGRSLGRDIPRWQPPPWAIVGLSALVLGFWVTRNLGGPFDYLAATAS